MQRQSSETDFQRQLEDLKGKVTGLQQQVGDVRRRIEELEPGGQMTPYAVVDRNRCTGCGMCEQVCPVGAIHVTYVAHVNTDRCTGCARCVETCPQGAVRLSRKSAATSQARRPGQDD